MNPFFVTDFSISDSLKTVWKSVLIYETIIMHLIKVYVEIKAAIYRIKTIYRIKAIYIIKTIYIRLKL